jgi:hypothetical protein
MENKKIWFRRKTYGWGWYPATWEGWAVLAIWLAFFIPIVALTENHAPAVWVLIPIFVAMLIVVCYLKGETPRWQWGNGEYHPSPCGYGLQIFLFFPIIIGVWLILNQGAWVPAVAHYIINNFL